MKQTETVHRYPVKITPDLRAWLAARADANSRTINGEILAILKDAKGGDQKIKLASRPSEERSESHA